MANHKKRPGYLSIKKRVVIELSNTFGIKPNNAKVMYEILLEIMTEHLAEEGRAMLDDFGTFVVVKIPRVGIKVKFEARKKLKAYIRQKILDKEKIDKDN